MVFSSFSRFPVSRSGVRHRKTPGLWLLLAAVLIAAGCSGNGGTKQSPGDGSSSSSSSSSSASSSSSSTSASSSSLSSSSSSSSSGGTIETKTIAPDDAAIDYLGRVDVTSQRAAFDWPGVQIRFRVDASYLALLLDDGHNDYNLFVDGVLQQVISTETAVKEYPVHLSDGEHQLVLTKRNGPNFGQGQFLGLALESSGELLSPPARAARKIEFIGDSYTVGYGDEGPGLDCGGVYRPYENSYLSFASIAARALGADSHLIAISGRGAVRNYGDAQSTSAEPLPHFYDRTLMSSADLAWDFNRWVPDAVVIKLGTNDHSTQPQPDEGVFLQGIHDLIAHVYSSYGERPVFLVADNSLPVVTSRMQKAVTEQAGMGNNQVYYVEVTHPPQSQLGCDWHPLAIGHQAMAEELADAMAPVMGWEVAANPEVEVTPFRDNAKGAYSIILDDYCASWTSGIDEYAIPALLERDLRAGLGAIGAECDNNDFAARLHEVAEQGFEIVNHTWTHPALVPCDTAPDPNQQCAETRPDFAVEIDQARTYLENASGKPVEFFIFPFNSVDTVILDHLRAEDYTGARGGTYSINPADFTDPMTLNLQGYQTDLSAYVEQAMAGGQFALRNLHGVEDESWESVPLQQWHDHLDYLKALTDSHQLWVDNPTAIVRYSRAKALCGTPVMAGNQLSFTGAAASCERYATGLTVRLATDAGVSGINAIQHGQLLPTRKLDDQTYLVLDVDPLTTALVTTF